MYTASLQYVGLAILENCNYCAHLKYSQLFQNMQKMSPGMERFGIPGYKMLQSVRNPYLTPEWDKELQSHIVFFYDTSWWYQR